MNTSPFLVNALLNDVTMVQALVDNGCLCSGIIDESLATSMALPRIPISPRSLETAEDQMILGKKWLEDQDALIESKEQRLKLRRFGAVIYSVKRWRQNLNKVARPRSTPIKAISAMLRQVPVCKASLDDINKALRSKASLSVEEARKRTLERFPGSCH